MYDLHYTLTMDDHRQIIDFQLKGRAALTGGKKKKEGFISRIFYSIILLDIILFFCNMGIDLFGYAGFFVLMFFLVLIGVFISTWGQRKIRLYRIRKEFRKTGGPQGVHLVFDKQEIRIETMGWTERFSYSTVRFMATWLDIAVVAGKTFVVYFPIRAAGSGEDVLELKRFVEERIAEGKHDELDRAGLEAQYQAKCPYCFVFEKTREEAAEFEARMTPKPFISAEYWSGSTIFLFIVYLLAAGLVLRGAYLGGQLLNAVIAVESATVFLAARSILRHRYWVVRRKNLLKAEEKLALGTVGWQLMAFCEETLVTANPWEVREVPWTFVDKIVECKEGAAFVPGRRRFFALPEKVFESDGEKQKFIDYCRHMKTQAENRKH